MSVCLCLSGLVWSCLYKTQLDTTIVDMSKPILAGQTQKHRQRWKGGKGNTYKSHQISHAKTMKKKVVDFSYCPGCPDCWKSGAAAAAAAAAFAWALSLCHMSCTNTYEGVSDGTWYVCANCEFGTIEFLLGPIQGWHFIGMYQQFLGFWLGCNAHQ